MNVRVEAKGAISSGKTYVLDQVTKLLEELGFITYYNYEDEHRRTYWRSDDYNILEVVKNEVE